jgi:hypothetical protein
MDLELFIALLCISREENVRKEIEFPKIMHSEGML